MGILDPDETYMLIPGEKKQCWYSFTNISNPADFSWIHSNLGVVIRQRGALNIWGYKALLEECGDQYQDPKRVLPPRTLDDS